MKLILAGIVLVALSLATSLASSSAAAGQAIPHVAAATALMQAVEKLYVVEIWDKEKKSWRYHMSFYLEVQAQLEAGKLRSQGKTVRVCVAL